MRLPTQRIQVYCPQKWKFAFGLTRTIKSIQQYNTIKQTTQLSASSECRIMHTFGMLCKSFGALITSLPGPCVHAQLKQALVKSALSLLNTVAHSQQVLSFKKGTSQRCSRFRWGLRESGVLLCLKPANSLTQLSITPSCVCAWVKP